MKPKPMVWMQKAQIQQYVSQMSIVLSHSMKWRLYLSPINKLIGQSGMHIMRTNSFGTCFSMRNWEVLSCRFLTSAKGSSRKQSMTATIQKATQAATAAIAKETNKGIRVNTKGQSSIEKSVKQMPLKGKDLSASGSSFLSNNDSISFQPSDVLYIFHLIFANAPSPSGTLHECPTLGWQLQPHRQQYCCPQTQVMWSHPSILCTTTLQLGHLLNWCFLSSFKATSLSHFPLWLNSSHLRQQAWPHSWHSIFLSVIRTMPSQLYFLQRRLAESLSTSKFLLILLRVSLSLGETSLQQGDFSENSTQQPSSGHLRVTKLVIECLMVCSMQRLQYT